MPAPLAGRAAAAEVMSRLETPLMKFVSSNLERAMTARDAKGMGEDATKVMNGRMSGTDFAKKLGLSFVDGLVGKMYGSAFGHAGAGAATQNVANSMTGFGFGQLREQATQTYSAQQTLNANRQQMNAGGATGFRANE